MCGTCGWAPRYWIQYIENVMKEIEMKLEETGSTEPAANVDRKRLYRVYISGRHGFLGECSRVWVPSCVKDGIKKVRSDGNGEYMGFMDE